jgi:hypothetical protein
MNLFTYPGAKKNTTSLRLLLVGLISGLNPRYFSKNNDQAFRTTSWARFPTRAGIFLFAAVHTVFHTHNGYHDNFSPEIKYLYS